MRHNLILGGALLLIVAVGVLHGLWTERWGGDDRLPAAVARMETVPSEVGVWQGRDQTLSAAHVEHAELAGYLQRAYVSSESKQTVLMMLLCGKFGPISVHTPEVCYGGAGYVMLGSETRYEMPYGRDQRAQFWTARFHKPGVPDAAPLRILWGWSADDGVWQAPDHPRLTFRRAPVLFKLYLVREMASKDEPLETDPCLALLKELLPVLDHSLFAPVDNAQARPTLEMLSEVNSGPNHCLQNETARPGEFLPQQNRRPHDARRRTVRLREA